MDKKKLNKTIKDILIIISAFIVIVTCDILLSIIN